MRMRNDDYKEGDILQKCCEHQKNRIARLKAEVERMTAFTTRTIIPNEELQAQVEQLTEAGDLMFLSFKKKINPLLYAVTKRRWNAAKEGKSQP